MYFQELLDSLDDVTENTTPNKPLKNTKMDHIIETTEEVSEEPKEKTEPEIETIHM